MRTVIFGIITLFFFCCKRTENQKKTGMQTKVVVAHRGASGYLPEHTMEAKAMAYAMQPDYIEQDLVLSKDDVPIVIHDIYLGDVTDVAEKYSSRKREDGKYYVIDFTYEELKQLNVSERFNPKTGKQFYPNRFPKGKSKFRLHSLEEEIELIQGLNISTGKNIGIYPEIKNPAFHNANGKDISKIVVNILADYGYTTKKDNCILQCFDAKELERVRKELKTDLFLVQLIEFPEDQSKARIQHFATYANGIGPWYRQILDQKKEGKWTFTKLVEDAHELGLKVHTYTLRADQLGEFSTFKENIKVLLFEANVDGCFTDFPDKVKELLDI